MLDMTEQQNMGFHLEKGMKESEAKTMAHNEKMSAARDIKKLMARNGMLK